jgi:hypothetical protein
MRWRLLTWIGVANLWGDGGDPIEVCVGSVDECINIALQQYSRYLDYAELTQVTYCQ